MSIKSIDLGWITTPDLKRAKNFFVDTLGLKLSRSNEEMGWLELQGSEGGGVLGVGQYQKPADTFAERLEDHKPGDNVVFAITVTEIEKMKTWLESRGVKCAGEIMVIPGHVKLATFFDPENNMFQLVERIGQK